MNWKIGNINIDSRIVLAPMAGISNATFMKICEEMGVGLVYTELISAEAIVRENKKTFEMLNGIEKLKVPTAVQIFGSDAKVMAKAAKIVTNLFKNVFIDINMGCPVPKVAIKSEAGSALLKNPEKIREIVSQVVAAVDVPVTVKIRSGWDEYSINASQVAKICESSGASAIAIHARTRKQGYSGKADWNIIKDVVESVKIPVIGNGDVLSITDAKRMLSDTGCTAVMIGRGLLGNPWLIRECNEYLNNNIVIDKPSLKARKAMMKRHTIDLAKQKNERVAVLEMRTNLMYYLKGISNTKGIKNKICQVESVDELINVIEEIK